jgi:hypothetical protein
MVHRIFVVVVQQYPVKREVCRDTLHNGFGLGGWAFGH